jgi:hypothetical protein
VSRLDRICDLGATPNRHRRIASVAGETFKDERMKGTVQAPARNK